MERLTDQRAVIEPGTYLVLDDLLDNTPEIQSVSRKELYYRLGLIENALGKNYDLDHLRELVKADREGRCVVLPVKPGDTVRFNGNPRSKLEVVDAICIYANGRITYNFHTTGMRTTYVDEWDEDDADKYCPVNAMLKERE